MKNYEFHHQVLDCWSSFDDYVKLLVSGKWTVINYEDRVTLIA